VAVDAGGRPREIPGLVATAPEEVRRMREAEIRRAHRLARKAEIDEGRGASPRL
jgi:acyl-CoA hydrolase